MNIAAIVKCSLVDYPGRITTVVFVPGCNLRCFYCHNKELINESTVSIRTTAQEVLVWLKTRQGLLDAVVISGGEPTLQPNLLDFINEVKQLGFLVKLDTNGTQPFILKTLLSRGILDYVAMDIKAPMEKYNEICGAFVDHGAIEKSIGLLINGHIDYEFRTTMAPQLTLQDVLAIGNHIKGAQTYVLQKCRIQQSIRPSCNRTYIVSEIMPTWCMEAQGRLSHVVKNCVIRGLESEFIPAEQVD